MPAAAVLWDGVRAPLVSFDALHRLAPNNGVDLGHVLIGHEPSHAERAEVLLQERQGIPTNQYEDKHVS